MKLRIVEQDYVDKYGNYTDYNLDGQYEITVDKFGCLIYKLNRILKSTGNLYYLAYYEYEVLPYLEIAINPISHIIERITIMPTEIISVFEKSTLTKIPNMEKILPKIEILEKEGVVLIEVNEFSADEWKNQYLQIKDENLHFIYYELDDCLYCINSNSSSRLYSYKVCDLARMLVDEENKICGVIFKNYKKAKELPNHRTSTLR